jgi:hypothetical protein
MARLGPLAGPANRPPAVKPIKIFHGRPWAEHLGSGVRVHEHQPGRAAGVQLDDVNGDVVQPFVREEEADTRRGLPGPGDLVRQPGRPISALDAGEPEPRRELVGRGCGDGLE